MNEGLTNVFEWYVKDVNDSLKGLPNVLEWYVKDKELYDLVDDVVASIERLPGIVRIWKDQCVPYAYVICHSREAIIKHIPLKLRERVLVAMI